MPGLDCAAASGSQVWNGHKGALIANAKKKPRKSIFCVLGSISKPTKDRKSKVPLPNSRAETTYRPINDANMNRPPSRL